MFWDQENLYHMFSKCQRIFSRCFLSWGKWVAVIPILAELPAKLKACVNKSSPFPSSTSSYRICTNRTFFTESRVPLVPFPPPPLQEIPVFSQSSFGLCWVETLVWPRPDIWLWTPQNCEYWSPWWDDPSSRIQPIIIGI